MKFRHAITAALICALVAGCGSSSQKASSASDYANKLEAVCGQMQGLTKESQTVKNSKGTAQQKLIKLLGDVTPYMDKLAAVKPPANYATGVDMHRRLSSFDTVLKNMDSDLKAKNQAKWAKDMASYGTVGKQLQNQLQVIGAKGCQTSL
ncbi:MAG: hypothetical protein J2O48_12165 [Solirubrobacterales bacterium]|nr:hypothetical protein [Solirubrobacterales bacterium]